MTTIVRLLALFGALVCADTALAQTAYPTRSVKIIVPFAAGGPTDLIARIIAQKLSESLGKQFYVENIPHGGSNTGMVNAAKSPADGHTILVHGSSFIVNPSLYAKVPFDPVADFAPVTLAGTMPNLIVVHPSIPAKNIKELIALVKAGPGKYNFAHPGTGTTPHLAGELGVRGVDVARLASRQRQVAVVRPQRFDASMSRQVPQVAVVANRDDVENSATVPASEQFAKHGVVRSLASPGRKKDHRIIGLHGSQRVTPLRMWADK